jgi:hypothetical protein
MILLGMMLWIRRCSVLVRVLLLLPGLEAGQVLL